MPGVAYRDRIDSGPFNDYLKSDGVRDLVLNAARALDGVTGYEVTRQSIATAAKRDWIAYYAVDRILVKYAGIHPCVIYGDEWFFPADYVRSTGQEVAA